MNPLACKSSSAQLEAKCYGQSIGIIQIELYLQVCICLYCDGGYRLSPNHQNHQYAGALTPHFVSVSL